MQIVYLRGDLRKHWQGNGELKEKWKMTKEEYLIKLFIAVGKVKTCQCRPHSLEVSTLGMRELEILCSNSHQSVVKSYWQQCYFFNTQSCLWRQTWLQQPDDGGENGECTTVVSSGDWDRDLRLLSAPMVNRNAISQHSS